MTKSFLAQAALLLMLCRATPLLANAVDRPNELSALGTRAHAVLLDAFNAREDWVSIHAAEILVEIGRADIVRDPMLRRMDRFEKAGTRVGAWRVMSMMEGGAARNQWNEKLEVVVLDASAPDRFQALESLAKVKHRLSGAASETVVRLANNLAGSDVVVLAHWALASSGDARALETLVGLLESADVATRRRAAYALRRVRPESAILRGAVLRAFEREPRDTIVYPYLLCAVVDFSLDPAKTGEWSKALRAVAATAAPKVKFEALQVLAAHYGPDDVAALVPQLADPDGDVRAGAALALLRIIERNAPAGAAVTN